MSPARKFNEYHYLKVPNFLVPTRAQALARMVENHPLGRDVQCSSLGDVYNHPALLEVLCEKVPVVSKLIGEPVLPTYTFARAYTKGSVLVRHSDRPSCEISLTVNLDCSKVWPIWIASPKGDASVPLAPGEAMLYHGFTDHWRQKYTGKFCTQAFLHYVRARGPYSQFYFDRVPT
jgi:hypothetical protein